MATPFFHTLELQTCVSDSFAGVQSTDSASQEPQSDNINVPISAHGTLTPNIPGTKSVSTAHLSTMLAGVAYVIDEDGAYSPDSSGQLTRVKSLSPETINILKTNESWYADNDCRKVVYNDPAARLVRSYLNEQVNFNNLPILDNHNPQKKMGRIVHGSVAPGDNRVYITAEINDPQMVCAIKGSNNLSKKSFSIGYDIQINNHWEVTGYKVKEVSVVDTPFFDNCHVHIFASKETNTELPSLTQATTKDPDNKKINIFDNIPAECINSVDNSVIQQLSPNIHLSTLNSTEINLTATMQSSAQQVNIEPNQSTQASTGPTTSDPAKSVANEGSNKTLHNATGSDGSQLNLDNSQKVKGTKQELMERLEKMMLENDNLKNYVDVYKPDIEQINKQRQEESKMLARQLLGSSAQTSDDPSKSASEFALTEIFNTILTTPSLQSLAKDLQGTIKLANQSQATDSPATTQQQQQQQSQIQQEQSNLNTGEMNNQANSNTSSTNSQFNNNNSNWKEMNTQQLVPQQNDRKRSNQYAEQPYFNEPDLRTGKFGGMPSRTAPDYSKMVMESVNKVRRSEQSSVRGDLPPNGVNQNYINPQQMQQQPQQQQQQQQQNRYQQPEPQPKMIHLTASAVACLGQATGMAVDGLPLLGEYPTSLHQSVPNEIAPLFEPIQSYEYAMNFAQSIRRDPYSLSITASGDPCKMDTFLTDVDTKTIAFAASTDYYKCNNATHSKFNNEALSLMALITRDPTKITFYGPSQ